jgi:glycerol-3-phosphate acyltransferase PlsY
MVKSYWIVAVFSYFLGSIPFGYVLVLLFRKQDIRTTGSGNIGATNVARSGAKGLAALTLLLDAGKGALSVWLATLFPVDQAINGIAGEISHGPAWNGIPEILATAAVFAIVGHLFPFWLVFKGGKGVATALGAFAIIAPKAVLVCFVVFAVVVAVSRYISLGSILSAAIFPPAAYWLYPELRSFPVSAVLSLAAMLIIVKHHANIRRLAAGTESKFGKPKPPIDVERDA